MSAPERGLGRGLDTLFRTAGESANAKDGTRLALTLLCPHAGQPRKHFDETALEELAASIRAQGIIQPLLVRPVHGTTPQMYEIVAGERRWRAARKAGLGEVPVVIREMSDADVLAVALIENLQREDLNPVEEAQAMEQLRTTLDLGQEELATRLGKSRSAIANALRLLQLPASMLPDLEQGRISAGHGRALLAVSDAAVQQALFTAIVEHSLSVRDAEAAVTHWKRCGELPASLAPATHVAKVKSASARTKPELILTLQKHLRARLHPKTTLSGTADMGRVTVPYESSEQLAALLDLLGVRVTDEALMPTSDAPEPLANFSEPKTNEVAHDA